MGKRQDLVEAGLDGISARRWRARARVATTTPLSGLRKTRRKAETLKTHIDAYLRTANDRLAIPKIGSEVFRKGRGTDWAWRADAWRWPAEPAGFAEVSNDTQIAPSLTLFHDCQSSEISTRQLRNQRDEDLAPYGIRLDVFGFDGSFLSVVLDLPETAVKGLRKTHLVRLNTIVELERPIDIYARLNIQHGPNTEQLVRKLPIQTSETFVEFDLDTAQLNEKRIERMWLDLIFDTPEMNQITLRELSMSRSPRSEL